MPAYPFRWSWAMPQGDGQHSRRPSVWEGPHVTETVDTSTGVAGDQSAPDTTAAPTRRRRSGGGLEGMLLPELKQLAGSLGIKGAGALRKGQLIEAIKAAQGGSAPSGGGGNGEGGGTSRATQPTLDEAGDTPPARPVEISAPREEALAVRESSDAERRTDSGRRAENGQSAESGENRQGGDAGRRVESGQEARQDNRRGERENRQDGEGRDRSRQQDGQNRDSGGQGGQGGQGGRGGRGGRERFDVEPVVTEDDVLVPAAGILDVLDNYAFVRTGGYLPGPNDVYVSLAMVKRYGLRKGDAITGAVRQPREGERKEKFNPLVRIDTVNGSDPEAARHRPEFQKLVPLYATERLRLETEPQVLTTRIIDIMAPIGKGNRGLIVSPAKAGKTMILQSIANAITTNNPEVHLMVVLVDERPEEVTDMQRTVKGEVIASTFDRPADDHTTVAELAIERAKRLVELGHDVVVLLDSITRLGRAYNIAAPASGRILSGGVDSSALYPPKRFFGAARNIEDGGSLTILATALIETGSRMDEVIFEEFKGTGNMELRLRREYADKRIFPAIDVDASSTRREELLMSKDELAVTWKLRRVLSALDGQSALELMINKLKDTKSNIEFLLQVNKTTPSAGGRRTDDGD